MSSVFNEVNDWALRHDWNSLLFCKKKFFFDRKRGKTRKFPIIKNFFEMLFSARMNGELALDTIITFLKDFQIFAKKICLSSLEKLGYKM